MAVQTIKIWTCDLCGRSKREETNTKPSGWAEISYEDQQIERSFIDKCVCKSCIDTLTKSLIK